MQKRRYKVLLSVVIVLVAITFASFGLITWRLHENGKQVYTIRNAQIRGLMQQSPVFFDAVFTEIIPKARACQENIECTDEIRNTLNLAINDVSMASSEMGIPSYFSTAYLANDQPMYFITLDGDRIVKLFFSGDIEITPITTSKEVLVQEVMLGKRKTLYGLQANVDGLRMTYLNDLYSEAEVIVPYVQDGAIIGAVVYLHGD